MNHLFKTFRHLNRMKIGFICWTVFLVIPLVLFGFQGEQKVHKDGTLKQINHFFFLTNNNLFNGRWLLENKDIIHLTKNQKEKIENLMLEYESFSIRNSAEIKIKELRFAAYLETKKINRKEIEVHIREISKLKTNLIVNYINHLLDVKELLTPQQVEILKQIKHTKKEEKQER